MARHGDGQSRGFALAADSVTGVTAVMARRCRKAAAGRRVRLGTAGVVPTGDRQRYRRPAWRTIRQRPEANTEE
jgi:hypothetical protein